MSWIEDEIERWKVYESSYNNLYHEQIPTELQVGKILESCCGNISQARAVIKYQLNEDGHSDTFRSDPYWIQVSKRFETLLAHNISKQILEENDDNSN